MKLMTDNGRIYSVQPIDYISNEESGKSKGHIRARKLIKSIFGTEWILEEIPAKCGKTTLYIDFLLPQSKIAIEVQGVQHDKFVEHFHKTKAGFRKSLLRDSIKLKWCELNNIRLIYLHDNESDEEWKKRIKD